MDDKKVQFYVINEEDLKRKRYRVIKERKRMRLIDATRLVSDVLEERDKIPLTVIERYSFGGPSPFSHGQSMRGGIRKALRCIEQATTIDAVPVVRCKDCAKRGGYHCPMFFEEQTFSEDDGYDWIDHDSTTDEGFCHCGVRLEDWIDEPD